MHSGNIQRLSKCLILEVWQGQYPTDIKNKMIIVRQPLRFGSLNRSEGSLGRMNVGQSYRALMDKNADPIIPAGTVSDSPLGDGLASKSCCYAPSITQN